MRPVNCLVVDILRPMRGRGNSEMRQGLAIHYYTVRSIYQRQYTSI